MSRWAGLGGILLGLAILSAPVVVVAAEAPAAAGPVLDLPKLLDMALKFSPDVKAIPE